MAAGGGLTAIELAQLFVAFTTRGAEGVMDHLAKLNAAMDEAAEKAKKVESAWVKFGTGATNAFKGFGGALGPVVGYLRSFVDQGIAASNYGQVLNFQMAELSRQMASIFVPTIEAVIQKLNQLLNWFRSLTGEQQKQLRQWGLTAAGIVAVSMVLPRIVEGFKLLIVGAKGLGAALTVLSAHPFVALAVVIGGLVLATGDWKKELSGVVSTVETMGGALRDVVKWTGEAVAALRQFDKAEIGGAGGSVLGGLRVDIMALSDRLKNMAGGGRGLKEKYEAEGSAFSAKLIGAADIFAQRWKGNVFFGAPAWAIRKFRGTDDEAPEARKEVLPRVGAIESSTDTWNRIAMTARNMNDPTERSAATLDQIRERMDALSQWLMGQRPALK